MAESEPPWARSDPPPQGSMRRVRRGTNPDGSTWEEVYEQSSSSSSSSTPGPNPFPQPPTTPRQPAFPSSGNGSDAFFQNFFRMVQQMQGPTGQQRRAQSLPEVELSLDEAFGGERRQVQLGNGRQLIVQVPAGVEDGAVIRLPEGAIRVRVREDRRFGRRGRDLSTVVEVAASVLDQGGEARTPLAGGGWIKVRVPAGTRPETCLRVAGKGMPDVNGGKPGDLYVYLRTAA
ncbi:MAG TPA: DnaJ C-terminal domain-containing protein [Candidatus Dormibacteraeota bacterium]|nr:DnaJ C-terminal domain-containing protein [Candidatus Dormibacteraeota bacterium]